MMSRGKPDVSQQPFMQLKLFTSTGISTEEFELPDFDRSNYQ